MELGRRPASVQSWWRPDLPLLKQVMRRARDDDISAAATQLAFYFTFSFFPMLMVLASLLTTIEAPFLFAQIIALFQSILPSAAMTLVEQVIKEMRAGSSWGVFFTGLSLALWSSVSALHVLILAINRAHGVSAHRSYWKRSLLAVGVTMLVTVLLVLATALTLGGHWLGMRLAHWLGLDRWFVVVWVLLRWPAILIAVMGGLLILYTFTPKLPVSVWRALPGAILGSGLWIAATTIFAWYINNFASYNRVYGSIGGVIVLMLWIYAGCYMILLGAELNGALYRRRHGIPYGQR